MIEEKVGKGEREKTTQGRWGQKHKYSDGEMAGEGVKATNERGP